MDDATRRAIGERAYALWEEAGRPDGSAMALWPRAELELGVIAAVAPDDPFVTLQALAAEVREQRLTREPAAALALRRVVGAAVTRAGRWPAGTAEHPSNRHAQNAVAARQHWPQ